MCWEHTHSASCTGLYCLYSSVLPTEGQPLTELPLLITLCRPSTAFCRALDAEEEYNEIDEMATGMIARRHGGDALPPRDMQARPASLALQCYRPCCAARTPQCLCCTAQACSPLQTPDASLCLPLHGGPAGA